MTTLLEKSPTIIRDKCGTTSGYKAHCWKKEITCQPCRDANALHYREVRVKNPHYREKERKAMRKWREAHPEYDEKRANTEKRKAWRLSYIERDLELKRKWRAENPEQARERARKNNKRKRAKQFNAATEPYTTQQILDIYGTDCHVCKGSIDLTAPRTAKQQGWENGLHLDHVIPLALGGTDLISNVKPSHVKCNLLKAQRIE